jgi:thiamine pyrophosphate-dependent acetolactate synthase large subunit-like protein
MKAELAPNPKSIERPIEAGSGNRLFGSDLIAEAFRDLDIEYVALTPGSSFRGLHDSLVNYLENERPQVLLCLHEEHAVAIAHGYAKVTRKPMAAAVHSNVGLFHASMAIYNAWCDRMPVFVIGATGPVDATRRRPWIDWIHTSRDQGSIIRDYVKWDDQPASVLAARESILRAGWLARTAPMAPVYVNLDCEMQETVLEERPVLVDAARFTPPMCIGSSPDLCERVAGLLESAQRPVILMGRVSRTMNAWDMRVKLAEAVGARVVTSRQAGASFPTDHALHVASPTGISGQPGLPGRESLEAIKQADLILSLDWIDLSGTMKSAFGENDIPTVVQVSLDHQLHNGWSMEHCGLPVVDIFIAAEPDNAVAEILLRLPAGKKSIAYETMPRKAPEMVGPKIRLAQVAHALRNACGQRQVSLLKAPIAWNNAIWPLTHPLDYVGSDGGGGIGGGLAVAIGGSLALRGTDRFPVCITGDGDFVMGVTALWTAVHYRIPLLVVVINNQSFYNDEAHQQRMAETRGRPVQNKGIGIRMTDPELDLIRISEGQGAIGFGSITDPAKLGSTFREAIAAVDGGAVAVVDVRTATD